MRLPALQRHCPYLRRPTSEGARRRLVAHAVQGCDGEVHGVVFAIVGSAPRQLVVRAHVAAARVESSARRGRLWR